jgi:KTSC domain
MVEHFLPSSSHIDAVDYDSDAQQLVVTFKDGRSWQYDGVPVTVFQGLQHAQSVGSYFARQVKGRYDEQEI